MTTPTRLGRYEIERRIGSGAMGEVYLARDPQIERRLALKTLKLEGVASQDRETLRDRLLMEAKAAGRLVHPNVVTLFDTGEDEGVVYLAFEYVEGQHLGERVATEPKLTIGETLRIVLQVASALDRAQTRGIVHRDIKPSNILLDEQGDAKVADFGIAKMLDRASDLTVTGAIIGTPHYMSPEQIRADELDGRSDVFSLGAVLFELLHRERPFRGDTITTLVYQILHHDPIPQLRPDLPSALHDLLAEMLAKDVDERPWAGDVVRRLETLVRDLPTAISESPLSRKPLPPVTAAPTTGASQATHATHATPGAPESPSLPPPPPPSPVLHDDRSTSGDSAPEGGPAAVAATELVEAPGAEPTVHADSTQSKSRVLWWVAGCAGLFLAGGLISVFLVVRPLERWWAERQNRTVEAPADLEESRGEMSASDQRATEEATIADAGGDVPTSAPGAVEPEVERRDGGEDTRAPSQASTAAPSGADSSPEVGEQRRADPPRVAATTNEREPPQRQSSSPREDSGTVPSTRSPTPTDEDVPTGTAGRETAGPRARQDREPASSESPAPVDQAEPADEASAGESRTEAEVDVEPAPTPVPPDRTLATGTTLTFQVQPEDAYILFREVGERRFVQIGQAKDYDTRKRRGRTWDLPSSGTFEMILRAPGRRDVLLLLEATSGGSTTVVEATLQRGSPGGASPP